MTFQHFDQAHHLALELFEQGSVSLTTGSQKWELTISEFSGDLHSRSIDHCNDMDRLEQLAVMGIAGDGHKREIEAIGSRIFNRAVDYIRSMS